MRAVAATWALLLLFALLLAIPGTEAQGDGSLSVDSKLVLTGLNSIEGSGSVTLTLDGDAAVDLREILFNLYDASINNYLDGSEAKRFLGHLMDRLSGMEYWGVAIENPTDFRNMTDSQLRNATSGIAFTTLSSEAPIRISVDFDGRGDSETRLLKLSDMPIATFVAAIRDVTGYEFHGEVHIRDRVTMFGMASLTNPDLLHGTLSEIRTPLGSILWYSLDGDIDPGTTPRQETITYERFNIFENPQMAFVVIVFGCAISLRIPAKRFEKFEMQHPKKFRKFAKPLKSVRGFAWTMVALMVVIFLFPFLFSFASPSFMLYSSYLYFIAPAAVISTYLFSNAMYGRATAYIPEDTVIEVKQALLEEDHEAGEMRCQLCMRPIEAGLEMYECVCGFMMHMSCANKAQACPQCGEILFPEHTRSIECRICGETFLSTGEEDPFTLQCTKCGAFQEEVEVGRCYLVVDIDPRRAYNMIRSMGMTGRPSMVLTSEFPGKIREEYGLGDDFDVKWLSDSTTDIDCVNIKDLEGDAMETVSTFLMTTKKSGLLVDGVDTVANENNDEAALAFVKRLNDLAAIHGGAVILSVNPESISEQLYKDLADQFDEVHDYL